MTGTAAIGPNVKRLIIHKMSFDAIPPSGGFAAGLQFLSNPKTIADGWRSAEKWVREALAVVRTGTGDNPWRTADDEAIASELLRRIEEKDNQR